MLQKQELASSCRFDIDCVAADAESAIRPTANKKHHWLHTARSLPAANKQCFTSERPSSPCRQPRATQHMFHTRAFLQPSTESANNAVHLLRYGGSLLAYTSGMDACICSDSMSQYQTCYCDIVYTVAWIQMEHPFNKKRTTQQGHKTRRTQKKNSTKPSRFVTDIGNHNQTQYDTFENGSQQCQTACLML